MSPAFIGGMAKEFPRAELTVDKFHVIKLINDAVDEVRREEQREQPKLKKSRYLWLRKHEQAILHWFKTRLTNGLIEPTGLSRLPNAKHAAFVLCGICSR